MKKVLDTIDFIFNKVLPKKFIVITVATVIVFKGIEAPQEYWYLLIAYFTGNAAAKFVKKDK
jgi:hypothetical protein